MRIKVSDRYKDAVNPNLMRYWVEALFNLPDVQYVPESSDQYADIGIDTKNNVGLSVLLDYCDPWSLVHTLPVDELINQHALKLLKVPLLKPSDAYAHIFDGVTNNMSIESIDKWDIYSPGIHFTPMDKYIVPYLKHAKYIPVYHSIPEEIFYPGKERSIDVFFSGAMAPQWYPLRNIFHHKLIGSNINYVGSGIGGDEKVNIIRANNKTIGDKQKAFELQLMTYANNIRNSKIFIFCDSIFKFPFKKYIEGMACGALVMAPVPIDAERLGFVDGQTMVVVNEDNFMDKIKYYLSDKPERKRITDNAYDLFRERYTCKKSVEQFMNKVCVSVLS